MSLRPPALAAALCLLASLAPAPPAAAGTKLDLSPYLGQVRQPGDFEVYAWSTGGTRTVTTLAAEPWAKGKGWAFRVESRLVGLVKAQTRVETWQNGALEETQKWIESLASGSLGGVPFP